MQVYPVNTLEKIEFREVCEQIARSCSGKLSREAAVNLYPSSDFKEVTVELDRAQAFLEIRSNALTFPEFRYIEVDKELSMLKIGGAVLEGQQLMLLRELSVVTSELITGVRKMEEFPALQEMVAHTSPEDAVRNLVDAVLNQMGRVRSSASKTLSEIRRSIEDQRKKSNKLFDGLLRKYRKLGWLREYTESVYHDRRVLAVVAEYKNKIDGIIHGSSESGNTAFVEPTELVGVNNELASALREEKKEEQKILKQLTHRVSEYRALLHTHYQLLAAFDLLEAKTKLARSLNAVRPHVHDDTDRLLIRNAVHPVLLHKNKSEGIQTIPLNLELTRDERMLVISGPNAGGKSIALKTVGLLQMMVQSGLLIPVDESSELPVFAQLLVDIGDDQSIEHQLSTYSSRLKKLKHFLRVADSKSLILLDEFGTGSDPELGGAIAESILIHLQEHRPYGIITTHFGNIKVAAENLDGLRNGCMLFNEETLEPLYELKMDTPGSSYTFEVARKIGMDKKVLDLARKKVDKRKVQLDGLLVEMQQQYKQLEHEQKAIESERQFLKSQLAKLADERENIQNFKASQEKAEFKRLVQLGKKYEDLIDLWNEGASKKEIVGQVKQAGAKKRQKIQKAASKRNDGAPNKATSKRRKRKQRKPIEVGDRVKLAGGKSTGTVAEMEGSQSAGGLR